MLISATVAFLLFVVVTGGTGPPISAKFIVGNMAGKSHCWAVKLEVVTLLRRSSSALVDSYASMALFATAACTEVLIIVCTSSLESWTTLGRGCCCVVLCYQRWLPHHLDLNWCYVLLLHVAYMYSARPHDHQ